MPERIWPAILLPRAEPSCADNAVRKSIAAIVFARANDGVGLEDIGPSAIERQSHSCRMTHIDLQAKQPKKGKLQANKGVQIIIVTVGTWAFIADLGTIGVMHDLPSCRHQKEEIRKAYY